MLCKIVKEVNFLELSRKYILFEDKSMIKIYYHIIQEYFKKYLIRYERRLEEIIPVIIKSK